MKASNQKILDQDEVTAVSVNKSLLSVDYASTLTRHPEELILMLAVQKTSKSPTTSKKVKLGLKSQRSVLFAQRPERIADYTSPVCRKRSVITTNVSSNPL